MWSPAWLGGRERQEKVPPDIQVRRDIRAALTRARVTQDDFDQLSERLSGLVEDAIRLAMAQFLKDEAEHCRSKYNHERSAATRLRREAEGAIDPAVIAALDRQFVERDARAKVHGGYSTLYRTRAQALYAGRSDA